MERCFAVDIATDDGRGPGHGAGGGYDLLLLDVIQPRRDGWLPLKALWDDGRSVSCSCNSRPAAS